MNELNQWLFSQPLYWIMIVISLIIIITYYLYGARIIGWFGELWTKQALNKLPKDKYIIINDLLIKTQDQTHQIDHVVVSIYGIFSIETKQYNGFITGSKYDKNWIRHLGKKKLYYTNPIRQNYGHVKALAELLRIDESCIFNIVCISSNAKLKIKHDGELVTNITIADKIKSYQDILIHNPEEIVATLTQYNITDKNTKKVHIKNIKYIHCGNSSAVIQIKDLPGNMIRPGIMLYGYLPDESLKGKVNLKPSCVLKSKISFIKEVEKDTSISYGRTFITKRKSVIANVPIGYADGIRRSLSNNGYVIVDGMKAPIVGRVCMDSFMIDVTDVPNVKIGDEIFIWDNDKITLDEIAKQCGTINYEILSTISNRVVREIV